MKGIDTITGKYAYKIKGNYTTYTKETKEQHLSSSAERTDFGTMDLFKNS